MWTILLLFSVHCGALADAPREVWRFEASSNLYAPPLVADLTDRPGLDVVISDSEAGLLRCVDARGEEVWRYDGGWTKRLISPAALSAPDGAGRRRLAIGNGDGSLICLDAATGELLWRREAAAVEWGGALWARLGDANEAVVLGSEHDGVIAFSADGKRLWHYPADSVTPPLHLRGPLAACDITGDGRDMLFGLNRYGPFALDADGAMRWTHFSSHDFPGGAVVADVDRDGRPELFAASRDDNYLWRFDAVTGVPTWRAPLHGRVDGYSASSMAVGDVTGDGDAEILLGDGAGILYAFRHDGTMLWTFNAARATHLAVSLGDVTGDGRVDVLAAGGDHYLYCLTGQGRLQWRFKTGLRLIYPATLADLDHNGMTDILICGSDRMLRRLTLDGRHVARRMPWPARRYDAAQRGASFGEPFEATPLITRREALTVHGDFEQGKVLDGLEQFDPDSPFHERRMARPRGWRAESLAGETWGLSDAVVHDGARALEVRREMTVTSEPFERHHTWRQVDASVHTRGEGRAALRWLGDYGVVREDSFEAVEQDGPWTRLALAASEPPPEARRLVMVLETRKPTTYWDTAAITVTHQAPASFDTLVNQAGYDAGAPKRFVVQANFVAEDARFAVVADNGAPLFDGVLEYHGRIQGHYGNDWGHAYYTGDFSELNRPGTYRVQAILDGVVDWSWPFVIDRDRLWQAAARPAYRFFYYQRCGMAIPGFHEACHLDDAACPEGKAQYELWGGWHDAGDYNKYHNAPYVYGLAAAYTLRRDDFDALAQDAAGFGEFFEEILWGGDHVRRMVMEDGSAFGHISSGYGYWGPPELETDNMPGTGDERRGTRARGDNPDAHQAALARIAVLLDGRPAGDAPARAWAETAARSLSYALNEGRRGLWQLSTAIDLYAATDDEDYAALAKTLRAELFDDGPDEGAVTAMHIDVARRYDAVFDAAYAETLREAVLAKAETMLARAANPFGVYTFGPPENPNFFNTPADQGGWHVGTSSHLLEAAAFMAMAHQFETDPRYLRFVYDQFNWTLGMNPYNISLMEGVGSAFAPTYHHRYTFAGVARGAVPGGVVNGITWRSVGDDRPFFDMSGLDIPAYESNEVWLPHNTALLNALAQLMQTQAATQSP